MLSGEAHSSVAEVQDIDRSAELILWIWDSFFGRRGGGDERGLQEGGASSAVGSGSDTTMGQTGKSAHNRDDNASGITIMFLSFLMCFNQSWPRLGVAASGVRMPSSGRVAVFRYLVASAFYRYLGGLAISPADLTVLSSGLLASIFRRRWRTDHGGDCI